VEMNASSTRSKKSMQEQVADQLGTCSILSYDKGKVHIGEMVHRLVLAWVVFSTYCA